MRKRPSGSAPGWVWGLGGALLALAVAVPLLRQDHVEPAPAPPRADPPAPVVAPPVVDPKPVNTPAAEPTLEAHRARYVAERTRELVAEVNAGLGSSDVTDESLAADRAVMQPRAEREWDSLVRLRALAERRAKAAGGDALYLAAADRCWPLVRDLSRYEPVADDAIAQFYDQAVDREQLERRIGR